jgi:predicted double-glycine peptidase
MQVEAKIVIILHPATEETTAKISQFKDVWYTRTRSC